MTRGIFRRLLARQRRASFFAWQVELTTRCPLRCRMCIRDAVKEWRSADMPIDRFRTLAPYFSDVANVVLEGWGEPLLYKDLIEAVRTVKRAGPRAGFVTSGWGLNEGYIADLVAGGVDFIGFSLAGATPGTHNAIRVNSDLLAILQAIEHFNRIKSDRKAETPRLHIAFMMLRDNIAELPLLVELAKRAGIGRIILLNLVEVMNEWQNSQKIFSCGPQEDSAFLKEAEIRARESAIELKIPCTTPASIDICEEDPTRNLYISVDGEVAPCVHLYPPVRAPSHRIFCDERVPAEKVAFGNIFAEPLDRIWNSASYAAFRARFRARQRTFEHAYSFAASVVPDDSRGRSDPAALPDPPEPCRTCHRMLGI